MDEAKHKGEWHMLQFPKEYDEFVTLVRKWVVYHILLRVVRHDNKVIQQSDLKLRRAYHSLLVDAEQRIEKEIRQVKADMRAYGGKVIEEVQLPKMRQVHVQFRGFTNVHAYLNEVLLAECETALKQFVENHPEGRHDSKQLYVNMLK